MKKDKKAKLLLSGDIVEINSDRFVHKQTVGEITISTLYTKKWKKLETITSFENGDAIHKAYILKLKLGLGKYGKFGLFFKEIKK